MLLSAVLPGTGQWANGERVKAIALWCMVAGVAISVWLALAGPAQIRSTVSAGLLALIYLFVLVRAVADARDVAAGRAHNSLLSGQRSWYVVFMLLTVGPSALPFLWRSPAFTRSAKWGWTAMVLATTAISLWFVLLVGPWIERTLMLVRAMQP